MQRRLRTKVGRQHLAKNRRHAPPWVNLYADTPELGRRALPYPF